MKNVLAALAAAASLAAIPAIAQTAAAPIREITKIAGDVYRFRNNFHYSVFAVTPAGIIATDPINADAAKWLKAELAQRFKVPVRYVIYSHDHADHSSGGEVFADTATFVAHANCKAVMVGEKRPTAIPNITFDDSMALELGGTLVELSYVGRNHSNNSIVMRFPKERVLYAVDFIPVGAIAFRDFPDAYMPDWLDSLKRVEALDFDILAPGHGPLGNKDSVRQFHAYLDELYTTVLKQAREGKKADEVKQAVKMPRYESWGGYKETFELNVDGMYRMVQGQRRPN